MTRAFCLRQHLLTELRTNKLCLWAVDWLECNREIQQLLFRLTPRDMEVIFLDFFFGGGTWFSDGWSECPAWHCLNPAWTLGPSLSKWVYVCGKEFDLKSWKPLLFTVWTRNDFPNIWKWGQILPEFSSEDNPPFSVTTSALHVVKLSGFGEIYKKPSALEIKDSDYYCGNATHEEQGLGRQVCMSCPRAVCLVRLWKKRNKCFSSDCTVVLSGS